MFLNWLYVSGFQGMVYDFNISTILLYNIQISTQSKYNMMFDSVYWSIIF